MAIPGLFASVSYLPPLQMPMGRKTLLSRGSTLKQKDTGFEVHRTRKGWMTDAFSHYIS